jgi:hypothetical protein
MKWAAKIQMYYIYMILQEINERTQLGAEEKYFTGAHVQKHTDNPR